MLVVEGERFHVVDLEHIAQLTFGGQPTAGDRQVRDLFDHQLFPGSDHIHQRPDPQGIARVTLRPKVR